MTSRHWVLLSNEFPPIRHGGIGTVSSELAKRWLAAGDAVSLVGTFKDEDAKTLVNHWNSERFTLVKVPQTPVPSYTLNEHLLRLRINWQLRRLAAQRQVDGLIVGDYRGMLPWGLGTRYRGRVAVRLAGSNLVYDHLLKRPRTALIHRFERQTIQRASKAFAPSKFALEQTALHVGLRDDQNPTVIPNGIDLAPFQAVPWQPIRGQIVFVNSIGPRKGVIELLQALPDIVKAVPDANILLCGRRVAGFTEFEHTLNSLPESSRSRVREVGWIDRENDLPRLLAESNLACLPSHLETFGVSAVEAMAAGCPLIYGDCGPTRELVRHGLNGLICDPHDHRDIARKVIHVLTDPDLGIRLSKNAKAASLDYCAKKFTNRVSSLFD